MIDKICEYLTKKIRKENQEINDERAEIINYGLQLIIGEIPKMILSVLIAILIGTPKLVGITLLVLIPYRGFTGGFHLKTHIGCFIATTIMYTLPSVLAKLLSIKGIYQYIFVTIIAIFGIVMIGIYAPADTGYLPILRKKERKFKKYLSYIVLLISISGCLIIKNEIISNTILYTILIQTISITKIAYKISKCEYGYRNMVNQN